MRYKEIDPLIYNYYRLRDANVCVLDCVLKYDFTTGIVDTVYIMGRSPWRRSYPFDVVFSYYSKSENK